METSYDQILYRGMPFAQTHPDRLATLATLFGMSPAPINRCRVLEIGCGDGGNLIPMAFMHPDSTFTGFDLAPTAIAMGQQAVENLGLKNLRLFHADIMDIGEEIGEFDYIIAHGVYSWVPDFVREKTIAIAHDRLAPHGVAYISYNALPGCHLRQMIRDMMLFHLRGVEGPDKRIESAQDFLRTMLAAPDSKESSTPALMKEEVKGLFERHPSVLFHDELGEVYYPLHFHEFIAHAEAHGLQYLAEANFFDMETRRFTGEVQAKIDAYSNGSRTAREQYMDFLKIRKFRQTLLCHRDHAIPTDAIVDRVRSLYVSSKATSVSKSPDVTGYTAEEYRGEKGAAMKTAHPLAKAAMAQIIRVWPEAIAFDALLAGCSEKMRQAADPDALAEILLTMYSVGLAELHTQSPACVAKPGPKPQASALARAQVRTSQAVTTMRHTTVEATGELERHLLTLLDGTRDRDALASAIAPLIDPTPAPKELMEVLEKNLDKLARFGLLVA